MPTDLVVLLPPSEGKAPGGAEHWRARSGAFAGLATAGLAVVRAYADALLHGPAPAKVVGASGPLIERAQHAARLLLRNRAPSLPAAERFTGVVWEHLRSGDGDVPVERIAVVSALLGAVAGDDPVPDHRLKLSVSLPPLGRLDRFWRPTLARTIARWADGREVWDLLPVEHAAAVAGLPGPRVRVRFEGISGHDAKAMKGALARHLLLAGSHAGFDFHGWRATRAGDDVVVAPKRKR